RDWSSDVCSSDLRLPRRGTRARRTAAIVRTNLCLLLKYLPIVDPLRRWRIANAVRNEVQLRGAMVGCGPCRGRDFFGYLDLRRHGLDGPHRSVVMGLSSFL